MEQRHTQKYVHARKKENAQKCNVYTLRGTLSCVEGDE